MKKGVNFQMKYNTADKKEQGTGQVMFYRPYPAEKRKKMHPISIVLRVILVTLIITVVILFTTGRAAINLR